MQVSTSFPFASPKSRGKVRRISWRTSPWSDPQSGRIATAWKRLLLFSGYGSVTSPVREETPDQLPNSSGEVWSVPILLNELNNCRSHHGSLCPLPDPFYVFPRGDSKSHGDGQIRKPADAFHRGRHGFGDIRLSTRNSCTGHQIEKSPAAFGDGFEPLIRRRGSCQEDGVEPLERIQSQIFLRGSGQR